LTEHVVGGLFDAVTREVICPFFDVVPRDLPERICEDWAPGRLELVKDLRLHGNW
jgi:hypothetical protein